MSGIAELKTVMQRRTPVFVLAFLGFFLLAAGWAFAVPFDGPPDEFQHVVRAYGVVDGQIVPRADARVTVVQSLVPEHVSDTDSCFRQKMTETAACAGDLAAHAGDESKRVVTGSGAANYNPLYYYVIGLPIKLWPNWCGVLAARLITGAMCSALLAGAVAVAARLARDRERGAGFLLAGIAVAVTPTVMNLTGAVNPAGLEIAAGVALWAALIAIVYERDDSRSTIALLGMAAVTMAVLRQLGLVWLFGSLFVAALGLSRERMKELVRSRPVQVWAIVIVAAAVYGALWILLSTQGTLAGGGSGGVPDHRTEYLWKRQFLHMIPYYTNGLVGSTGYGDVVIPYPAVLTWFAAVGALIVPALLRGGRRVALQIAVGLGASYFILMYIDVQARSQGWSLSQGRYMLPILVGMPMLAAYHAGRHSAYKPATQRRLTRMFAVVLLPIQFLALWITMIRFQHGMTTKHPAPFNLFAAARSIDPFTGDWLQPLGPVLPIACLAAGIVLLAAFYWRLAGRLTPSDEADQGSQSVRIGRQPTDRLDQCPRPSPL